MSSIVTFFSKLEVHYSYFYVFVIQRLTAIVRYSVIYALSNDACTGLFSCINKIVYDVATRKIHPKFHPTMTSTDGRSIGSVSLTAIVDLEHCRKADPQSPKSLLFDVCFHLPNFNNDDILAGIFRFFNADNMIFQDGDTYFINANVRLSLSFSL